MSQNELYPATAKARPITYALLVPQSPYRMAAARFQSTLRGRLTFVGINSSAQTKRHSRDEALHSARSRFYDFLCPLMLLTRLAVGLVPLNAPDAAHHSPRSARFVRAKFGFPAGPATRRSIKRNKEPPEHLINSNYSQGGGWRENSLLLNYRAMEILRQ